MIDEVDDWTELILAVPAESTVRLEENASTDVELVKLGTTGCV